MDFGLLPDVIWMKIMSYLSLMDRYRLSMTCYKLYSAFSYPGVWNNFSIILDKSPTLDWLKDKQPFKLHQYVKIIKMYGGYFRNLSLVIRGKLQTIETEQIDMLVCLSKKCHKLERLFVDVGKRPSRSGAFGNTDRCNSSLLAVKSLVENSRNSLRELVIDSWLLSPEIAHRLPLNHAFPQLQKLSLFHPDLTQVSWVQLNAMLPSPSEVLDIIRHLQTLKVLSLHCQSVSAHLLRELTRTTFKEGPPVYPQLECLQILLTNEPCPFFEIPVGEWKQLSLRTPQIMLDISIANTIGQESLMFLAEVPLQSLTFAEFARYYTTLLTILNTKELRSFVDLSHGCSELSDLLTFVSSCPKLERLVYEGDITELTVTKLAFMEGKRWKEFKVNLDQVMVENPTPEGIEITEDDVIVRNSITGEVLQVSRYFQPEKGFFYTDDMESHRRFRLEKMEEDLRKHLGCVWMPSRRRKLYLI